MALVVDMHEVWLQPLEKPRPGRVTVDFSSPDMLHRRKSGHNEPLGRAVGVKADRKPAFLMLPQVWDETLSYLLTWAARLNYPRHHRFSTSY